METNGDTSIGFFSGTKEEVKLCTHPILHVCHCYKRETCQFVDFM